MSCSQYHMIWSDEIAARCFWFQPVEMWIVKLTRCSCLQVHRQRLASWCLSQAAINSWDTRKYSFQSDDGDVYIHFPQHGFKCLKLWHGNFLWVWVKPVLCGYLHLQQHRSDNRQCWSEQQQLNLDVLPSLDEVQFTSKQIFVCTDAHTFHVSNLTQMLNKNSHKWYTKEVFSEPHVWTNEEVKLKTKNNGRVKHSQRNQNRFQPVDVWHDWIN